MDIIHVSEEVKITLREEKRENILFLNYPLREESEPIKEKFKRKIRGVQLSYAYCREQDFGIEPMQRAFGAYPNGIITKIPDNFIVEEREEVVILKYGNTSIPSRMTEMAKNIGMVGYWDDDNLIICTSKENKQIIEGIYESIRTNKAKFTLTKERIGGQDLVIQVLN